MSSPMFIALPIVGSGTAPISGQDLSAYDGSTAMDDLTDIVEEPTLIEEVTWSAQGFSTHLGMLVVAVSDGTNRRLVGAYPLEAGTAGLFASGRIEINFTIAAGFQLVAAHNTQDGSGYVDIDFVPLGGVIRGSRELYGTELPGPDVFYRGKIFTVFSAIGNPDAAYVCLKLSDDSYGWSELGAAP